jgi:signal transduction histidine kinase
MFFVYTSLDSADYIRSIRVASFSNEASAKEAVSDLKKFLYKKKDFLKLYQENHFEIKITLSGKYYLLVIEPFTDRPTMQSVLDIVRERYKGAYPKKLFSYNFTNLKDQNTTSKTQQKVSIAKTPEIVKKIEKKVPETKVVSANKSEMKKEIQKALPVEEVAKTKVRENQEGSAYYTESTFVILLILIVFLLLIIIIYMIRTAKLKHKSTLFERMHEHTAQEIEVQNNSIIDTLQELKTPMEVVSELSHVMQEDELRAYQEENLKNIANSSDHVLKTINNILEEKHLKNSEIRIVKSVFNINNLLEHVLNMVYMKARSSNVSVNIDIDKDVPVSIISDSLRLSQVLINLLSHAIETSRNSDVTLCIEKKDTSVDGNLLVFKVVNTGTGMTKEEMNRIFDPNAQSDGIGLLRSKELIEKMGAEIRVQSEKGSGTTVVFTIAIKVNESNNEKSHDLLYDILLNKNILIIEESNKNAIALLRAFEDFKSKIHVMPSLEKDFTKENEEIEIVVVNQRNLSSNVINKLHEMQLHYKTKIILTGERNSLLDKETLEELDITGFLQIPFTQQSLVNVLRKIYEMKEQKDKQILVAEDHILSHKVLSDKTNLESRKQNDHDDEFLEFALDIGLKNYGDKESYANALEDFKMKYASSVERLEELCSKGDFKAAKKITMDIKEIALTLGAYHLFEKIDTLQHELQYEKNGNLKESIEEYRKVLEKLLGEINHYLESK